MSWAKRIRHPSEMVKKGDELEIVVLEIDSEKRRISLGMKQVKENPWTELAREFNIGSETTGVVTRILDRGAVVELRTDVEGFVPLSHLGIDGLKKPTEYFDVGAELPLKVIKMDPQNKRIVLSVNAYLEGKDQQTIDEFRNRFRKKAEPEGGKRPEGKKRSGETASEHGGDQRPPERDGEGPAEPEAADAIDREPETEPGEFGGEDHGDDVSGDPAK
jgi:small subunit ribosomal protein S1